MASQLELSNVNNEHHTIDNNKMAIVIEQIFNIQFNLSDF